MRCRGNKTSCHTHAIQFRSSFSLWDLAARNLATITITFHLAIGVSGDVKRGLRSKLCTYLLCIAHVLTFVQERPFYFVRLGYHHPGPPCIASVWLFRGPAMNDINQCITKTCTRVLKFTTECKQRSSTQPPPHPHLLCTA